MDNLAPEILKKILYPLPAEFRLVSRLWLGILTSITFERVRVPFKDWKSFAKRLSEENIQGFSRHVQKLSIVEVGRYMKKVNIDEKWTDHVQNVLDQFPNLQEFRLTVMPHIWHEFYQSGRTAISIPGHVKAVSFLGVPVGDELGIPVGDELGVPIGDELGVPIGDELGVPVGDEGRASAISPITLNALRLPRTLNELEIGGICCCGSNNAIEASEERKAPFLEEDTAIQTLRLPYGLHCDELYPLISRCKQLINLYAGSTRFDEGIYRVRDEFARLIASPIANRIQSLELTHRSCCYEPNDFDFHLRLYWSRIDLSRCSRLQHLKISARYILWVDCQREAMDVVEAQQALVQSLPCALKTLHITSSEELIARNHTMLSSSRPDVVQSIFHLLRTRKQLDVTMEGLDRPGLNFVAGLCHLLHLHKPADARLPHLLIARYHPRFRYEGNGTLEHTADWVDSCLRGEERDRVVPLGHPSLSSPHPSHAQWLRLHPDDGYDQYKPTFSKSFLQDLEKANRWFRNLSTSKNTDSRC